MVLSKRTITRSAAIGAAVIAAALLAAGNAQAGKLCLTYPSKMRYYGLGEDYWTSNGNKPLAYAYARITRSGTTSAWSGYLDRGGCAPSTLTWVGASANYTITVWSKSGTIVPIYGGGTNIGVEATDCGSHTGYSAGDACPGSALSFTYPAKSLGAFTATTVALGPVTSSVAATQNRYQAIYSAMMLGTFALATDAGGTANSNRTFYIRIGNRTLTKTNVMRSDSNGNIEVNESAAIDKMILVHEIGHAINWFGTTGGSNANLSGKFRWDEYDKMGDTISGVRSECNWQSTTSHMMLTPEWGFFGHIEGLANAYASSVWNDRKGSDCWIPYWRSWEGMSPPAKVTCSASGSNPGTYLDHVSQTEWCKSSPTYMGGEYDWMRTWNKVLFHPTAPFDMAKVNDFIQTGSGWNCGSAYDIVLTPCHVYGGQGFWTRLITGTATNGVKARLTAADAGPRYGVDH